MKLPVNLLKTKTGVKVAAILLIVTFMIITFTSMTMGAPGVTYGDVNNDGDIDVRDVVLVMQYIIGLRNLTDDQLKAADVSGDGNVNVQDATMIMQHVLGIEELAVPVESVEKVEISVPYGTPKDDIDFPETVTAILQDESEEEIDVEWETTSEPAYNSLSPDDYTFKGDLVDLPAGIANPDEIQAVAVVTVEKINVPARRTPTPDPDPQYTLTLDDIPVGAASSLIGGGNYEEGQIADIIAIANAGYVFDYWYATAELGSFGDNTAWDTTYTMPDQNIIVTAHFNAGGIDDASAADFVYNETETEWSFTVTEVDLLEGQTVTVDLSEAIAHDLQYSIDEADYTLTGFDVDASDAQTVGSEHVVLTATTDITAGTVVELSVSGMTEANASEQDLSVIFTRTDTGESDSASFDILDGYSLTLADNPEDSAETLEGAGVYFEGTGVEISTTPNPGYKFEEWTAEGGVGSFVDYEAESTTFTMPREHVTATASYIVGDIANVSASSFVYTESTTWTFNITEVKLDGGQKVVVDLSNANRESFIYSEDGDTYIASGFAVYAGDANDSDNPVIELVATADVELGKVDLDVPAITTTGDSFETEEGLSITVIRQDTERSDTSVEFDIEEKTYTLTVNDEPEGSAETLDGAGDYQGNRTIPISTTPSYGYVFSYWQASAGYFVYDDQTYDATNFVYEAPAYVYSLTEIEYIMPYQDAIATANFVYTGN